MDTLTASPQSAAPGERKPHAVVAWLRSRWMSLRGESPWEFVIFVVVTSFLLFYGLVPVFGGDRIGLVGADEPRYAQIAREMLQAHNRICGQLHAEIVPHGLTPKDIANSFRCLDAGTVTPILYGHP